MAYAVQKTSNVPYGPHAKHRLDVHKPTGAPSPAAAIVMIHGGGFEVGDKATGATATASTRYAGQGRVVFNINFRSVSSGSPPGALPNPAAIDPFPAMFADAQSAVRWVRSQASVYGVDPDKVFAMGFSSGAWVSAMLGVYRTIHPSDMDTLLTEHSPAVAGSIVHSGTLDFSLALTGTPADYLHEQKFVNWPYANTPENMAKYQAASPAHLASATSSPMAITHGVNDPIIPIISARNMRDALTAAGVPIQYVEYNGGHVFQGVSTQKNGLMDAAESWARSNSAWP